MDCLQEWPEPVVPVQSLSESGDPAIPDRYIKPPSERPSLDSTADKNILGSPVIDLGRLSEGAPECRAIMRAISDACRDWGFFQVVNHGGSHELMERIREVWKGFFHLPMEVKKSYANSPRTYEGYGSRLGVRKDAILDWGDYYFLQYLPPSVKNHDKWPRLPTPISCEGTLLAFGFADCTVKLWDVTTSMKVPRMEEKETIEEYGSEMVKLCEILMKVLSISLGLDVEFLHKAFGGDDVGACLRVNYYPKCPQPDLTLGISAHFDPGVLTMLLTDDRVKGLQVRKGDAWITIHPVPHALIIIIGDQIEVLSNAIYKSVEHRVVVNAAEERLSLAFFCNPKSGRLYVRKNGPKGKTQVESLKAI